LTSNRSQRKVVVTPVRFLPNVSYLTTDAVTDTMLLSG
jgi:hypothetical protein